MMFARTLNTRTKDNAAEERQPNMTRPGFIVAVSQKEAEEIAESRPDLIHRTLRLAQDHLAEVKAPPTDSYYAAQYGVYVVKVAIEEPV